MNGSILDVIVIGAGHAGLTASYYLKHLGLEHLIFERGRIGESWRTQRWSSMALVTMDAMNQLPGSNAKLKNPEQFGSVPDFITGLQEYAASYQLPVSENATVVSVNKTEESPWFNVVVSHDNEGMRSYNCWQVIIASGAFNKKKIPLLADSISPSVRQLHSSEYKNVSSLSEGAVLVVGSGQSGSQITQELIEAGRKVFLATSRVPRLPRRYRGKDIFEWLVEAKMISMKASEIEGRPSDIREPLLSGWGEVPSSISLQALARKGATLMGRVKHAENDYVIFDGTPLEHVTFSDGACKSVLQAIDKYINVNQLQQVPDAEQDEADIIDDVELLSARVPVLSLQEHAIATIIWATGFQSDYGYIKFPVFKPDGTPQHQQGITAVDGLYFLGLPWQRTRRSGLILGIKDDAGFITSTIYSALR